MIIDVHGHYTTAPAALGAWRDLQIAALKDPSKTPDPKSLKISDDELRESIETNQLKLMKQRGSDLTIFSPRASFMAHHIGDFQTSATWAAICNELCHRVAELFPDHFIGAAMLPQSPGVDPASCIPELEKCVKDYGFVGLNLNPDPSGGHWTSPPLTDRHWYPLYEKMVEYDIPAMIHVSTSCNACFHTTGAHYLNADTTAFMQCIQGDLFKDFPTLKFLIPHGGGAVPYHWGRFRGLAQEMKKPLLDEHLLNNIFFDTCVYHQPGIDLLTHVIPVKNILFASEMIGAVRGIDPTTGHYYDDTKRYIEATVNLSAEERHMVYEGNARRVFPRLDAALNEAIELLPDTKTELTAVDGANSSLVTMEDEAFSLVRQNQRQKAWELLNSDAYRRNKSTYAAGLESFSSRLLEHSEAAIRAAHREARRFLIAATCLGGVVAVILLAGCYSLVRTLRAKTRSAGD